MPSFKQSTLRKELGFWDSIAISVGIAIGVGIFRVPSEIAAIMPYPQLIITAWLVGGLLCLFGALCYAELSSTFPETGGDYVYIRENYGLLPAFLYGWASIFIIRTGIIAAVAFVFSEYLCSLTCLCKGFIKPVAISTIVSLSLINGIGVRIGKNLLNFSVMTKVIALVVLIICALSSSKGSTENLHVGLDKSAFEIVNMFALALVPVLWTYGGWHESTFMTGETKDAQKVLPIALITATLIITGIYVLLNVSYLYLIPVQSVKELPLIAGEVMKLIFGKWAKKGIEFLIVISSFGTLNATIMTSSRITYAMSKDNPFFKYQSHISNRFGTPFRALVLNAVLASILVAWGTFNKLLFFTGLLVWLFFGVIVSAVIVSRIKHPELKRPFKAWGYPFTPVVFACVCFWMCVDIFFRYKLQSICGLGIMISGIVVYKISMSLKI
jgi:amino acid transporter